MSGRPEYEYNQAPEDTQEVFVADSGALLCGRTIYLAHPTKDAQIRYHAARADRVIDLMTGVIGLIEELHTALKSHMHLGTPASVLSPDQITVQKIDQISQSLQELKDKLETISSPKVFIP
jgi:MinD-like ATPase involved in chromosome partitioning or flagellar assembly